MAMTTYAITSDSTLDAAAEPGGRAIHLGLGGLSAGIADMGSLAVTIDGVPDAARLSAGQFLGDGSWSVRPADLDGLALHPSPGRNRNCQLSIRLRKLDKDMGDAFSIGAVYVDVDGEAGQATIAGTDGAISLQQKGTESGTVPPEKVAPKPVKRIVRVTRSNPARSTVSPDAGISPPRAPPDRVPTDQDKPAWATVTAPVEMPFQAIATPDPTELGIAPPEVLDEKARPPSIPAPVPRRVSPVQADETGIVPVHVTPGLRIGKFGKTGRPEEVVSVRGRDADAMRARPDRSSSIVMVRRRSDDSRSA